jgi:hypothetical protein
VKLSLIGAITIIMGSIAESVNVTTHAAFRYITKGLKPTESPHLYHLPELAEFDVLTLSMRDIRNSLDLGSNSPYKLNKQGFTARRCPTALKSAPYTHSDWNDEAVLKEVYIPEIEALLKEVTGGKMVLTDQVVMRNTIHSEVDGLARKEHVEELNAFPKMVGTKAASGGSPAPKVHLDYAPAGARMHLRKYHERTTAFASEIIEAENRLLAAGVRVSDVSDHYDGLRWAMFSIWRPLKTVKRDPLALSDCRTFPKDDYVDFNVLFPTGVKGEGDEETHREQVYLAHGSEKHKWHWISNQQPDEVLIIQLFDSDAEKTGLGVAGGVMHSSVHLDGTENEEARESIEVRCTVIW